MRIMEILNVWHDVILFVLNFAVIAPFTAALVEIYDRKEKSLLRNQIVVKANGQIIEIIAKFTMAYRYLSFVDIYASLSGLQKAGQPTRYDEDSGKFVPMSDQPETANEGFYESDLRQSIHGFRRANESCKTLLVAIASGTGAFDGDEMQGLLVITNSVESIESVSSEMGFYLENILHQRKPKEIPDVIRFKALLDQWQEFVLSLGKSEHKHIRLRFADRLARTLGYGTIFPDIEASAKSKMLEVLTGMRAVGNVDTTVQARWIAKLATLDIREVKGPQRPV